MTTFTERVYTVVRRVPAGRVTTYGAVAAAAGRPGAARAVGTAMKRNPLTFLDQADGTVLTPCHRVIRADGAVGGFNGGEPEKERLLMAEGVEVVEGKVDLKKYQFHF